VKEGECRQYRSDGTLSLRTRYVAGVQEGDFTAYHADGRVAREGRYQTASWWAR
jgi:antitoxin component YwqK of YwqJK toxin-antitoxin module